MFKTHWKNKELREPFKYSKAMALWIMTFGSDMIAMWWKNNKTHLKAYRGLVESYHKCVNISTKKKRLWLSVIHRIRALVLKLPAEYSSTSSIKPQKKYRRISYVIDAEVNVCWWFFFSSLSFLASFFLSQKLVSVIQTKKYLTLSSTQSKYLCI